MKDLTKETYKIFRKHILVPVCLWGCYRWFQETVIDQITVPWIRRHMLQSSSKVLLKGKGKCRHHKSTRAVGSGCCRKNVRPVRTRLKPRWLEERKIYYTSGSAPGSLQKWHWPCSSWLRGFYVSECGSKQAGRTKADVAVSLLLRGYNLSY
jgi:hypothetical protein